MYNILGPQYIVEHPWFVFRGSKRFVIVKNIINLGKTKDYRMHKRTASASTHTYAHPVKTQYYILITNRLCWLTKQWNFAILLCNRDCLWNLYALGERMFTVCLIITNRKECNKDQRILTKFRTHNKKIRVYDYKDKTMDDYREWYDNFLFETKILRSN